MNAREAILQSIRRHAVTAASRPSLNQPWVQYEDRQRQFIDVLATVGGQVRLVHERHELADALEQLEPFRASRRRCLLVEGAGQGSVDLDQIEDPHELEDVDFALLPAQLAVAENGALWVECQRVRHRVIYFIAQHLGLVVDADRIVNNMHEAYEQIQLAGTQFGCFISGPSKTADIEQSLVIGAHGPRSLTVFLVGDASGPR